MESELFKPVPMYASTCFIWSVYNFEDEERKAAAKIHEILKAVCRLHKLPLALTWISRCDFDDLYIKKAACYVNDSSMQGYFTACAGNPLKKGQHVAGKAVNSLHEYSVPDVSLLDLADYPFANDARKFGLRAAMAVGLKCKPIGKIEFVSEIFLPTNLEDSVEQNVLINEILLSLHKNCEDSETMELQIESLIYQQADLMLNLSGEVEASHIPSVAVSKSSFSAFSNVGLNLKEKIQNNRVETDEPHEQATVTECELFEPETLSSVGFQEAELSNISPDSNRNIMLNISIPQNTVETNEPNELEVREKNAKVELDVDGNKQVGETQQSKRINKREKKDTQQTMYTPKPRKTTSVVWKFFIKVKENGEVHAKCPVCKKELCAKSRNGTTSLHKHGCFKDWKKDEKQQSVSNVESSAEAYPKNKASPKIGAGAPPQAKRRKPVPKVGEEREERETSSASTNAIAMAEEEYPIVSGIGQAAASGLAHDQVQELTVQDDYTAKETPGRGLKDQEHHLVSDSNIELLPTETQSSGQQANNMAIDGTGGVAQVECTQIELTAEDGDLDSSTTSSIATASGFPVIFAASELRSFLSQSPLVLLSPTENDRFCSLLNAEMNAASNECVKHAMRQLLAEVHRLNEAIASCPFSSRPETVSLLNYENLALAISQSAVLHSNLEAEITSLKDQAAQLEEQLKAINEQITQKEQELSILKESEAGMQIRALQSCQATAQKLKIDNIVAGMPALFNFVKSVLPKP